MVLWLSFHNETIVHFMIKPWKHISWYLFLIVKVSYNWALVTFRGHRHRKVKILISEAKSGENVVLPYL